MKKPHTWFTGLAFRWSGTFRRLTGPAWPLVVLAAATLLFVGFKLPHLSLPYFWDEAWVYGPAVRTLALTGPGLLPGDLPPELGRGHPLLFHFSASLWLRLFGNTLFASHLFALALSVLLVATVFWTGSSLFGRGVGIGSALLLMVQPLFLAQASLVLPEILLALLALLSIRFFLREQWSAYMVAASLMVLTKETGLVFVGLAVLLEGYRLRYLQHQNARRAITRLLCMAAPILVAALFFALQFRHYGWFLFPEHAGLFNADPLAVWNHLTKGYAAFLFIYQGRNLLFFSVIALGLVSLVRKRPFPLGFERMSILVFILGFLIASSLHFYSNRYITCLLPLFLMLTLSMVRPVFRMKSLFAVSVLLVLAFQSSFILKKGNNDHSLGFVDAVKANQALVEFGNQAGMREEPVCTGFVTRYFLSDTLAGYVDPSQVYRNLRSRLSDECRFVVSSNFDPVENASTLTESAGWQCTKVFRYGKAEVLVYQRKSPAGVDEQGK